MTNALQVTISGSYRTSKGETIDFEGVSGIIPAVDEDLAAFHVRGRYAAMWVKAAEGKEGEPKYKERIEDMRQVFIDKIEAVDAELSFLGKDIKEMSYEELQDLATAKDLRRIPLHKAMSLRETREIAYVQYWNVVLGKPELDPNAEDFNYAELPELVVEDTRKRRDAVKKLSNDDVLAAEEKSNDMAGPEQSMTLDELKSIAKQRGIQFKPNIGFKALYDKIYKG